MGVWDNTCTSGAWQLLQHARVRLESRTPIMCSVIVCYTRTWEICLHVRLRLNLKLGNALGTRTTFLKFKEFAEAIFARRMNAIAYDWMYFVVIETQGGTPLGKATGVKPRAIPERPLESCVSTYPRCPSKSGLPVPGLQDLICSSQKWLRALPEGLISVPRGWGALKISATSMSWPQQGEAPVLVATWWLWC